MLDRAISNSYSEFACIDTGVLSQNRRLYVSSKLNTVDQLALAEATGSFGTAADPFVFVWSSCRCHVPYVERCRGAVTVPAAVSLRSLYVPALVLILWVSGCRALVVALVGTKRDSVLIPAQI